MKKMLASALLAALLLGLAPAASADGGRTDDKKDGKASAAYTAEEVLYGVLDHYGSAENVYAVVILSSDEPCKAVYYGPFADVKNLSDTRELELKGNRVTLDGLDGRFYFQSTLKSTSLPWDIAISYTLDGKPISAGALGGRSGKLGMSISVSDGGMEDETFYDSFMVQVSVTLDSQLCRDVTAEGATIANAGADKQISFTALPGQDSEFELTAEVTDFTMSGVTFAAVPFSMGDALGDVTELTDGLRQLTDAVSQLSGGAAQLAGGAGQLTSGAKQFGDGLYQLSENSASLVSASEMFLEMFNTIRDTLVALSGLPEADIKDVESLIAALDALMEQLDGSAAGLEQNAAELESTRDGIDAAFAGVRDSAAFSAEYLYSGLTEDAKAALGDDWFAALDDVTAAAKAAVAAKAQWQSGRESINNAVQTMRGQAAYMRTVSAAVRGLRSLIAGLSGTEDGNKLNELIEQVSQLADGYAQFHKGLVAYTDGVNELAANWGSLYKGIVQLAGGTSQLSDGTRQLDDGTKEIPAQVDDMLSPFTGGDYSGNSFLSSRNENTASVQFVLTTRAIERPETGADAPDDSTEQGAFRQLIDRIIGLFTT